MTPVEIQKVLEEHAEWLLDTGTGKFADLHGKDLRGANLRGKNLRRANLCRVDLSRADLRDTDLSLTDLSGADLRGTDLRGADLRGADLRGADLRGANMRLADLRKADLRGADLHWVDLCGANLTGADLSGADLHGAELEGVKLEGAQLPQEIVPEEDEFVGWKKCMEGVVKLLIPADARRISALRSRKCRADKARVLETPEGRPARSHYEPYFWYEQGKTVEEPAYDPNRWVECSRGIHFFMTRQEAEEY